MSLRLFPSLQLLIIAAFTVNGVVYASQETTSDSAALRDLTPPGFFIGAAVRPQSIMNEPEYTDVLAREFNMLTTENHLKMHHTQPRRGEFTFDAADAIIEFAERHNMKVRGHTLVWHDAVPRWLRQGEWNREEALEIMREHIFAVAERYQGRLQSWDVVNEYFMTNGGHRTESFWYETIGPDFMDYAFQWAREADPHAKLFYNDYGAEGMNAKSDAIYEWVKDARERGIPVDGVGLQMHVALDSSLTMEELSANVERLRDLGLIVHITELDIRIPMPASDEKLERQRERFFEIVHTAHEADCEAVVLWGFTDRYSWIPRFFEGYGAALPFDEEYQPKPAYMGILEALRSIRLHSSIDEMP